MDCLEYDDMFVHGSVGNTTVCSTDEIGREMDIRIVAEFVRNNFIKDMTKIGADYALGYGASN